MWETPSGERTLAGHEAGLIRALVGSAYEWLEHELAEDYPWTTGVTLFDALPLAQKFTVLARVANGLLGEGTACPPLDAIHEATVGMLYDTLGLYLQGEIESEEISPEDVNTGWRRLALAAVREVEAEYDELPEPDSDDLDKWEDIVEVLADEVLWDDDWRMPDIFMHVVMDSDPDAARLIKENLSISDDYYTAVPPEPSEQDIEAARQFLRQVADEAP